MLKVLKLSTKTSQSEHSARYVFSYGLSVQPVFIHLLANLSTCAHWHSILYGLCCHGGCRSPRTCLDSLEAYTFHYLHLITSAHVAIHSLRHPMQSKSCRPLKALSHVGHLSHLSYLIHLSRLNCISHASSQSSPRHQSHVSDLSDGSAAFKISEPYKASMPLHPSRLPKAPKPFN